MKVLELRERVFSGADLMAIMDQAQIGVGSTIHIIEELEIEQNRSPKLYRNWTFPKTLKVADVLEMIQ